MGSVSDVTVTVQGFRMAHVLPPKLSHEQSCDCICIQWEKSRCLERKRVERARVVAEEPTEILCQL